MIEITISKEGEVKIKVDNQAQSVSVSRSEAESVIQGMFKSQVPKASSPPPPPTPKFPPGGIDITGEEEEVIIKKDEWEPYSDEWEPYFNKDGRVIEVNKRFAAALLEKGEIIPFSQFKRIIPSESSRYQEAGIVHPGILIRPPSLHTPEPGQFEIPPKTSLDDICKKQNICGYEPKNYQNKPGCKSGEIEGGPTY